MKHLGTIAGLALLALVMLGALPARGDDCAGLDYSCAKNQAYAEEFLVTELRSAWVDDPQESPPDCDGDDLDLLAPMVSYATRNLDIYYPWDASRRRKVVFFVHGGSWESGYKDWYQFVPKVFTGRLGWVTVVVNYRLVSPDTFRATTCPSREACAGANAPDGWEKAGDPAVYTADSKAAWYPDNLEDVAAALAWVAAHIGQAPYYGDDAEIFLFGHSAGGHLVSLLATHPYYGQKLWGPPEAPYSLRSRVRGVVSLSGVYSLGDLPAVAFADKLDQLFQGCGHTGEPACAPAVLDEASPLSYVAGQSDLPPFFLLTAESDLPGFAWQEWLMAQALAAAGVSHEDAELADFDHVTEMQAIAYTGADEPATAPLGDPDGAPPTACLQNFGPNPKPADYRNPTDRIVDWIERTAPATVTMYRAYNPNLYYHFFTTSRAEFSNAVAHGYADESSTRLFRVFPAAAPGAVQLYRLYNPNSGLHYYTCRPAERDWLVAQGWNYEHPEGWLYPAPHQGLSEIFHLYHTGLGTHLYTSDAREAAYVTANLAGWEQHQSLGWAEVPPPEARAYAAGRSLPRGGWSVGGR
ncbi:MAG: alpha/beta hydrolase fold domain-containing protein [Deltaproteobacteria bacterium]|nr:alpha/beta hydrolase fold domain-containing protein [Deltaproteobacteria bacterium]